MLEDPAATWKKLERKFARKSEMGHEATQKAFTHFQHQETETIDGTITRFEVLVETCLYQGDTLDDQMMERALLSEPNERYEYLKKSMLKSSKI